MGAFEPQRADGRSDRRVVLDYVQGAAPERIFTYDELATELEAGVGPIITRERTRRAVLAATRSLLKTERRHLENVRGLGYRVIPAQEHRTVAIWRQTRAERQIRRGIDLVRHVRLEELDETQKRLTVGQLTIMNGMYMMLQGQQARQDRMDQLFEGLEQRMRQLEQPRGED